MRAYLGYRDKTFGGWEMPSYRVSVMRSYEVEDGLQVILAFPKQRTVPEMRYLSLEMPKSVALRLATTILTSLASKSPSRTQSFKVSERRKKRSKED